MRAYSYDLRLRVLHAVDQGKSRAEIIKTFDVSRATIKRYLKLRRETGDVKPKAIPGRPAKKGAALLAGLQPQLDAHPDATLAEHCHIWKSTQSIQVSTATMSRAIQHLNWTRKKKTLRASEQKEADRAAWREQAQTLDGGKLVFVDECGSTIALTRLHTRSPRGKRAYGTIPRNRRANIPLLAALSLRGMGEAFMLEGSADTTVLRPILNGFSPRVCNRDKWSSWIKRAYRCGILRIWTLFRRTLCKKHSLSEEKLVAICHYTLP
ncbi:MAG TPA: IS630 transposase-related protein [Ktedonobacteraceae bacterium]